VLLVQHGFVISAAIDKYVYIAIDRTFTEDYFIKCSALERATTIAEIMHPIALHARRREYVTAGDLAHRHVMARPLGISEAGATDRALECEGRRRVPQGSRFRS
jgi:hypothetical protein